MLKWQLVDVDGVQSVQLVDAINGATVGEPLLAGSVYLVMKRGEQGLTVCQPVIWHSPTGGSDVVFTETLSATFQIIRVHEAVLIMEAGEGGNATTIYDGRGRSLVTEMAERVREHATGEAPPQWERVKH